jgi:hypothetical protein
VPLDVPYECFGLYGEEKCTLQSRGIILEKNKTTCLLIIPQQPVLTDPRCRI